MLAEIDALELARWVHVSFNSVEVLVWWSAAVYVGVKSRRLCGADRRVAAAATVFFVAFGVSDVWEIFTGTWFRPFGLLALKTVCAAVFVACLGYYRQSRRKGK